MKFRDILQSILEGEFIFHASGKYDSKSDIDVNNVTPYYSDAIIFMSGRDTGHFGSGMYFSTYSCKDWGAYSDRVQKYKDNYKPEQKTLHKVEDTLYRVSTDLYENLYRVRNENQGRFLHKTLSFINRSTTYYLIKNADQRKAYPIIKHNMELLGLKMPPYKEYVNMVLQGRKDIEASHGNRENKNFDRRSMSTRIMEYNGYNGVNVSGVPELDNTTYGSVIYDMSKIDTEVKPMAKNEVNQYCSMGSSGIINKEKYKFTNTPEQEVMALLSKQEPVNPYAIVNNVPEKYAAFFFNRYNYFMPSYAIDKLSDNMKKIYFVSRLKKLRNGEAEVYETKRDLKPLLDYNIDVALNPEYKIGDMTLLAFILAKNYEFDDKEYIIPIIKRIHETGRELNPQEQRWYDEIKVWNEEFSDWEGVF